MKARGRQRAGSTHVLPAARELTRLELVSEAVRAVLEELARTGHVAFSFRHGAMFALLVRLPAGRWCWTQVWGWFQVSSRRCR